MEKDTKEKEFYERLRAQLEQTGEWPSEYLFKFIVPSSLEKIAEIRAIFDGTKGDISTRDSSKGAYTSLSIKTEMDSPDAIITKYLEVSKVEGVISL